MARVFLLSDLHLSPTHGFFWKNFTIGRDAANAAGAELVIVNGDLCINGPDSDEEMAFAASALRGFVPLTWALPGNHDVGDEPPGQDAQQIVNAERLARWARYIGADRFVVRIGAWRLIGLNAQLFGSGLPQEADQDAFLDAALAGGGRIGVVLHKPLFLAAEDETEASASCMTPAPRARLLARLKAAGVGMVISGHLHSHRDVEIGGIRYLWVPAMAFLGGGHGDDVPIVAATMLDFSGETVDVDILHLPGLEQIDLAALKGHGRYAFLRDMPDCPPEV